MPLFFEIKKTVELGWFKPESLTMNINILKQEEALEREREIWE